MASSLALIFPFLPLHSRPSHISLPQCQVFTVLVCFTESHLVCSNISASLERCLRRDIFPLMRASRQCKRHLSLPAFIRTHLETHTSKQATSWFRHLTLYCYEHRQLANLPHFPPTQKSLSCFCQQRVGERGSTVCLLTVRKPSKTHTHTTQTQPYQCLHILSAKARVCTACMLQ